MTSLPIPNRPATETALERAPREYYDSLTPEEVAEENELAAMCTFLGDEIDPDQ